MSKRIRVSDQSLNVYGFRVLTSGIDMTDFLKNPIMLWNHNRGWRGLEEEVLPIGVWKDLKIEGEDITAMPEIDTEDSFASRIAKKFDKGHLRAASIGIQILEWSEESSVLVQGQTRPTVTKCKLREISIVDIPANKNAVVLYDVEGELIDLSDSSALQNLPTLKSQPVQSEMEELKMLAVSLGMAQTATLADVQAKISELQLLSAENSTLKASLKTFKDEQAEARKGEIKSLLDKAIEENRVPQGQRGVYEKLFEGDFENTRVIVDGLTKVIKLSDFPAGGKEGSAGKFTYDGKSFSQLSKENPTVLASLKENDIETFKQLYKAEYGKDYKETVR